MAKTPQIAQRLEKFINDQSAELQVVRVLLQGLVVNTLKNSPEPAAILTALQAQVVSSLENVTIDPPGNPDQTRMVEMQVNRAEQLFQEIAVELGIQVPQRSRPLSH